MNQKIALIIGAGPAGLTAAYELLEKTNIKPMIFEKASDVGGISKTINYKGNRMDAGGHRFFSKSERVMDWWTNMIPIQSSSNKDIDHWNIVTSVKTRSAFASAIKLLSKEVQLPKFYLEIVYKGKKSDWTC